MMIAARTLEGCLELLVPTPEEFSIPEVDAGGTSSSDAGRGSSAGRRPETMAEDDSDDDEEAGRRETGIIDPAAHAVTVTLKPGDC